MNLHSFRAVLTTAFSLPVLQFSLAQIPVTFPVEGQEGETQAVALPVDDEGTYLTVGIVGADVSKGKAGDQTFTLLGQDPQSRITLLRSEKAGTPPMFGSSSSLKPGSAVYKNPNKAGGICRIVSWEDSFHDQPLPLHFLRVHYSGTIPKPGQPLYDDAGKLVAIAHQPSPNFGKGTYALPIEAVIRNTSDFKAHQSLRRCWLGLHLDHKNPIPVIVGLRPESPAAEIGLQQGDVLVSLGDWQITTYFSAINAFYYLIPNQKTSCTYLRGTNLLTKEITPKAHPAYAAAEEND